MKYTSVVKSVIHDVVKHYIKKWPIMMKSKWWSLISSFMSTNHARRILDKMFVQLTKITAVLSPILKTGTKIDSFHHCGSFSLL